MTSVRSASVTWLGHATAVVEIDGERVLIDPFGRRRCAAVSEYHTILITHAHIDHLNRWTLARLDRAAKLVVPKGAADVVAKLGFSSVVEAEPGDHIPAGKLDVIPVETRHDSGRWRRGDLPICVGYVITHNGTTVHHSGDIDFSEHDVFEAIGERFDIDATLLPIGGMLPVWWYRRRRQLLDRGVHIDPDTALAIARRLRARRMVPVHWGTLHLRLGPPSAPRRRLEEVATQEGADDLIHILEHGGALDLTDPGDT